MRMTKKKERFKSGPHKGKLKPLKGFKRLKNGKLVPVEAKKKKKRRKK